MPVKSLRHHILPIFVAALLCRPASAQETQLDLISMSLEELIDIEVSLTSRFRLNIDGTATIADDNNVLQTLWIGNVDTTGPMLREVGDGIHIQVNVSGQDLFEGAQNVFSALLNLRNSLEANNIDGIRSSITDMQVARDRISEVRGVLGSRTERVEVQRSLLERFEVNLTEALSNTEDADLSKTVLQLQQEQNVFQSALVAGQTIIQPTLIDFFR